MAERVVAARVETAAEAEGEGEGEGEADGVVHVVLLGGEVRQLPEDEVAEEAVLLLEGKHQTTVPTLMVSLKYVLLFHAKGNIHLKIFINHRLLRCDLYLHLLLPAGLTRRLRLLPAKQVLLPHTHPLLHHLQQ